MDDFDFRAAGWFAVVIPVYNHGQAVIQVIRRTLRLGIPVFVVDDGSTDGTGEVLRSVLGIHLLRHRFNRGKGAALVTGMSVAASMADWAITLDGDGQHDPNDAISLVKAIPANTRPIVLGKRMLMKDAPWTSRFGRRFSNFWVWVSGGRLLSDSQSGFRVYPLPEVLNLGVKARKYDFEIEVLAKAAWRGITVVEAPVRVDYHTQSPRVSHFHPLWDFVRNTGTFGRLIVRRIFTPYLWPSSLRPIGSEQRRPPEPHCRSHGSSKTSSFC